MMKFTKVIFALMVGLMLSGSGAWAQTAPAAAKVGPEVVPAKTNADADASRVRREISCERPESCTVQTFYLSNVGQPNDANEILTALRNFMPPEIRLYLVPSQNAILLRGTAEQLALTQKIINDLDRPKKIYRLTYTMNEMDGGKRVGTQHFSMIVAEKQRVTLKQGSRVPVATGSMGATGTAQQTQFQYLDVGMNFDATVTPVTGGVELNSKVEQTSVAEEKSGVGPQDPVVRQTQVQGTSILMLGKPLVLGSVDVPGTTRRLEVEALIEVGP
jgi:type II secretory pathway component GspD/PulD (secretin)